MAEQATTEDLEQEKFEAEAGKVAQALNGGITISGNCGTQEARVRSIVNLAGFYAQSQQLKRCLARSISSYDDWSYPERVWSEIAANRTTHVECVTSILDGAGNPTTFTGQGFPRADGTESIKLATSQMPLHSDATLIGLILHEVGHNRSYSHPSNTASFDHDASFPQHLLACGASIHNGNSPALPLGTSRYDFATETTLAPVGGVGGAPFSRRCFVGNRVAGLAVRTGALVDSIGARCRSNPSSTPLLDFSMPGGSGGSPANLDCAAGEVMVGVYGHANNSVLTRVGPICASIGDVQNGATGPNNGDFPLAALRYRAQAGTADGTSFERICPSRMAVAGLRGRAGGAIDRLELFCQHIDRTEMVSETFLARAGGNGGGAHSDRCVGRSAMVGLTYDTDWVLARLGGICTELTHGCFGTSCFEFQTNGNRHALGSHGGGTFNPVNELTDQCPVNQSLVGLNIKSGALVDAVGGICANTVAWTVPGTNAVATTDLPIRGGAGGSAPTRLSCARGELLVGWELRAGSLIDSVQPVCRRFG